MAMKNFVDGEVLTESDVDTYMVNTLFARKTSSEQVVSSTTLQDDDDLHVEVEAGAVYELTAILRYVGITANDLKINWDGPAGFSMAWAAAGLDLTAASDNDAKLVAGHEGTTETFGVSGGAAEMAVVRGLVVVGGTAGTFKLTWAQNTSNATGTFMVADSYICLRRVD